MQPVLIALIGVVTAGLGYAANFFIARLKNSGKVNTSDAETLWAEAEKMRAIYREEAVQLRAEGMLLRSELLALRNDVIVLREETAQLRKEAVKWREEAIDLHAQIGRLKQNAMEG